MCKLLKQLESEKKSLEVSELFATCRYHKKKLERFEYGNIFKGFKCLELFHAVYPKVLALMYGANFLEEELVMLCPHYKNTVTVRLYGKPVKSVTSRFLNKVKQLLHPLRPMDIVNCVVYVEILSVEGQCFARYEKGNKFEIYHIGTICPQALYSVFPGVLLCKEDNACQCPSNVNRVVFHGVGK